MAHIPRPAATRLVSPSPRAERGPGVRYDRPGARDRASVRQEEATMASAFEAVRITERVYWVGAIDWALRNFHGYLTARGSTYNAFLVMADRVTLIDAVKAPFRAELLSRIASVIDPVKIDVIVSNHAEMDHSGCLCDVVAETKPSLVAASKAGVEALRDHFRPPFEITTVADGESLSLGNATLTFLETKMLHWPDSMVTYLAEEKLLFSQDAFGMHLASAERFADELPRDILDYEAAKYYANIVMPFAPVVGKALARIQELGLEFDMIAPDHGPIWRTKEGIDGILVDYARWAERKPTKRVVVTYETMWGSTERMAHAIGEGVAAGGASPQLMPLSGSHRSDIATAVLDAGGLVVGAPTMNNTMYPAVADVLYYLKGLAPKGLVGAAFGSYGWSGQAPKQVAEILGEMKVDLVAEPLRVKYVPDAEALNQCFALGRQVAERVLTLVS